MGSYHIPVAEPSRQLDFLAEPLLGARTRPPSHRSLGLQPDYRLAHAHQRRYRQAPYRNRLHGWNLSQSAAPAAVPYSRAAAGAPNLLHFTGRSQALGRTIVLYAELTMKRFFLAASLFTSNSAFGSNRGWAAQETALASLRARRSLLCHSRRTRRSPAIRRVRCDRSTDSGSADRIVVRAPGREAHGGARCRLLRRATGWRSGQSLDSDPPNPGGASVGANFGFRSARKPHQGDRSPSAARSRCSRPGREIRRVRSTPSPIAPSPVSDPAWKPGFWRVGGTRGRAESEASGARHLPLVAGLEFRRLKTGYAAPSIGERKAAHFAVALGFEF